MGRVAVVLHQMDLIGSARSGPTGFAAQRSDRIA